MKPEERIDIQMPDGAIVSYVLERTCHTEEAYGTIGNGCVLDRYKLPRCSECHYATRFEAHRYKYCPNCGAKVVE